MIMSREESSSSFPQPCLLVFVHVIELSFAFIVIYHKVVRLYKRHTALPSSKAGDYLPDKSDW